MAGRFWSLLPQFCGDAGDRRSQGSSDAGNSGPRALVTPPLQPQPPPRYAIHRIAGGKPALRVAPLPSSPPHLSSAGLFHSFPPRHTRGKVREPYGEPPGVTSIRLFFASRQSPRLPMSSVFTTSTTVCALAGLVCRLLSPGEQRNLLERKGTSSQHRSFPLSLTHSLTLSLSLPFHSTPTSPRLPPRRGACRRVNFVDVVLVHCAAGTGTNRPMLRSFDNPLPASSPSRQ